MTTTSEAASHTAKLPHPVQQWKTPNGKCPANFVKDIMVQVRELPKAERLDALQRAGIWAMRGGFASRYDSEEERCWYEIQLRLDAICDAGVWGVWERGR